MSSVPVNDYAVQGDLSITAANTAAAEALAATALADIKAALVALANGTEFSVPESGGQVEFDEPDGINGVYSVSECQLIVGAVNQGEAQSLAEAANTAIQGALPAGAAVTLESESEGAEGGFVFHLLQ